MGDICITFASNEPNDLVQHSFFWVNYQLPIELHLRRDCCKALLGTHGPEQIRERCNKKVPDRMSECISGRMQEWMTDRMSLGGITRRT